MDDIPVDGHSGLRILWAPETDEHRPASRGRPRGLRAPRVDGCRACVRRGRRGEPARVCRPRPGRPRPPPDRRRRRRGRDPGPRPPGGAGRRRDAACGQGRVLARDDERGPRGHGRRRRLAVAGRPPRRGERHGRRRGRLPAHPAGAADLQRGRPGGRTGAVRPGGRDRGPVPRGRPRHGREAGAGRLPHRVGSGRTRGGAARRLDARRDVGRGGTRLDRDRLLRVHRGLPQDLRHAAGPGVDRGADPLVCRAAGPRPVPRSLPGLPRRPHALPRRVARGDR